MKQILVVNPNSNPAVTEGIAQAVSGLQIPGRIEITCTTLAEGPFGIESQRDSDQVIMPLCRLIESHGADAFVIACYSDPGLAACRSASRKPVFGIQESGLFTALQRGDRVGVVALSPGSIARHLRYIRALGLADRLAGERPLNLSVAESEAAAAFPRLVEVAQELITQDGADTLLLGCAGMARHRTGLEHALSLPVTDPVQAATVQAVGALLVQ